MSRRILLCVLLTLGLAMGACTSGNMESTPAAKKGQAREERRAKGPSGGGSQKAGNRLPTPARGGRSGGSPRKPTLATGPGGRAAGSAADPISPGTYRYATAGDVRISGGASRDLPETTTLTARLSNGASQRTVRDLRDADGSGTVVETDLVYRAGGVYLSRVRTTVNFPGGLTDVRELKPASARLVAPTGAGPGFSTTFVMKGSGTTAEVILRAVRAVRVMIGEVEVSTLVVKTDVEFSGALTGYQKSTTWFWPRHVLAVKEQVTSDVQNGPIRAVTDYRATLENLSP